MLDFNEEEIKRVKEMLPTLKGIRYSREHKHNLEEWKGTDEDWLIDAYTKGWIDCLEFIEKKYDPVQEFQRLIQEDIFNLQTH